MLPVIGAAASLQSLQQLSLHYSSTMTVQLPQSLVWPGSLQSISLSIVWGAARMSTLEPEPVDLAALSDCSINVNVRLTVLSHTGLPPLLQSLACLQLHELDLQITGLLRLSHEEQEALEVLCCNVLRLEVIASEALQLLPRASKHVNLCWANNVIQLGLQSSSAPHAAVQWSALAGPGYYSLSYKQPHGGGRWHRPDLPTNRWQVQILGCPRIVPQVQPWALYVQDREMLTGVPLHDFELLESGWWVWHSPGTAVSQVPVGLLREARGNHGQSSNVQSGGMMCAIC